LHTRAAGLHERRVIEKAERFPTASTAEKAVPFLSVLWTDPRFPYSINRAASSY